MAGRSHLPWVREEAGKPKFVSCRCLSRSKTQIYTLITEGASYMADILDDIPANVKIRSPWAELGLFLRVVGFALLAIVALGAVAGSVLPKPLSNTALKLLQMVTTIILFGGTAFFYARFAYPERTLDHLGFRPAIKANFYLLSVLLLLF